MSKYYNKKASIITDVIAGAKADRHYGNEPTFKNRAKDALQGIAGDATNLVALSLGLEDAARNAGYSSGLSGYVNAKMLNNAGYIKSYDKLRFRKRSLYPLLGVTLLNFVGSPLATAYRARKRAENESFIDRALRHTFK